MSGTRQRRHLARLGFALGLAPKLARLLILLSTLAGVPSLSPPALWRAFSGALLAAAAEAQEPLRLPGFATPESVAFDRQGRVYVSNIGAFNPGAADGDGRITQLDAAGNVLADPFAAGLNDPKGLAFDPGGRLVVSDVDRLWRVDADGDAQLLAGPQEFPVTPSFLNDVAICSTWNIWVSDSSAGRVFRVTPEGLVTLEAEGLAGVNGLLCEPGGTLLLAVNDRVLRRRGPGSFEVVADGFRGLDGLALDAAGNLYVSEFSRGRVTRLAPAGERQVILDNLESAADLGINPLDGALWVPNFEADTMLRLPLEQQVAAGDRLLLTISPESGAITTPTFTLRLTLSPLSALDVASLRLSVGEALVLEAAALGELISAGIGSLEVAGELASLEFADLPFPLPGLPVPLALRFQAATTAGDLSVAERLYTR
ncbi:MAG: NHL repeat-containing protein [Candidatus Tectomicrobia bacterium]|nr:NHL repeat-containing protein [Candidatus Tectomicrobia bacterium]